MPVSAELIEKGRIIYFRTATPWIIDETFDVYKAVEGYLNSATMRLHAIIDIRELQSVPSGAMRIRNSPFIYHKNIGNLAVVGAQKFARVMADTVLKITNFKRAKFFESYEEAMDYLKQIIADEATG